MQSLYGRSSVCQSFFLSFGSIIKQAGINLIPANVSFGYTQNSERTNVFHISQIFFIFHVIPVFLHRANPRHFCRVQILADAFYQQIMLGYVIQTGDCDCSDHTHFFHTDRESAATGCILFLIQKSVCQGFSPLSDPCTSADCSFR